MKILFVNGTFFGNKSFAGGSELSLEYLAERLAETHEIVVVAQTRSNRTYWKKRGKIRILYTNDANVRSQLTKLFKIEAFEWCFTALIWSEIAIKLCSLHKVKSALFIQSIGGKMDMTSPTVLVANSKFTQKKIYFQVKRRAVLLYPRIDPKRVICKDRKIKRKYVTMFNPVVLKGGKIFADTARLMTDEKFLAVKGWAMLRDSSQDKFDTQTLRQMARCHGERGIYLPQEVDFQGISNIKLVNSRKDVKILFGLTKLLVVPSQWEEAFGRVIIEALFNGIPVVASRVGGIPEACSFAPGACLLLDKRSTGIHYKRSIEKILNDPKKYRKMVECSKAAISSFDTNENIQRFIEILTKRRSRYQNYNPRK